MSLSNKTLTAAETVRLKEFFDKGSKMLLEVDDIKGSLADLAKAIAEELEVKPTELKKALRVHHKASLEAEKDAMNTVEELLAAAGHA